MARAAREGAMCALRDVQRSSVVGDGAGGARSVEIAQAMVPLAGALARGGG